MKKYSLAICKTNSSDYTVIKWYDLKQIMQNQQVTEAIIFPVADAASETNSPSGTLSVKLLLRRTGLNTWTNAAWLTMKMGISYCPA